MNTGIVVDATCDLPASVMERNGLNIIPVSISTNPDVLIDKRHPDESNLFYEVTQPVDIIHCTPLPLTVTEVLNFLKDQAIYHYDNLLLIAPSLKISSTLTLLREGLLDLQPELNTLRKKASLSNPYRIRVVESHSMCSGYGLVVYEALQLIHEKARNIDQVKKPLDQFIEDVNTFILPGRHPSSYGLLGQKPFELPWLATQRLKLSRTIPCFRFKKSKLKTLGELKTANAENAFLELVYDAVTRSPLTCHLVNISFAGKLSQLRILPSLKLLQAHVQDKGGRIVYSTMSPVSASQFGAGALSVAFA